MCVVSSVSGSDLSVLSADGRGAGGAFEGQPSPVIYVTPRESQQDVGRLVRGASLVLEPQQQVTISQGGRMSGRLLAFVAAGIVAATSASAQTPTQPAAAEEKKDEVVKRDETIVVSASKVESTLINAPATMSVITSDVLATSPAQNYADLLRNVPGLNVIQMSARDINLTSRQSTATLSNSQLALLDGRSIYLDFFGLILWDLVPANMVEVKQIEVVRGPASAVWGANALTGVVNIITKSPRELARDGTGSISLNGGLFSREGGSRAGSDGHSFGVNGFFAQAPNETWAYKLSAGYFDSDPFSRPVGRVPIIADPRIEGAVCNTATGQGTCIGGAPFPADGAGVGSFENTGTKQPKVDARLDQKLAGGGQLTYSGGYAGTTGIVHTGIGPFKLQSGSYLSYGRVGYSKGALKIAGFANFLDAKAPNLLLTDPATLKPVQLNFKTQTYDFEVGHSTILAGKHILSYGGNARHNAFDITLAPEGKDRNEFGAYLQDEFFFDKFRFSVGGRVDKFGNLDKAVFSPRVTAMFKPTPEHAVRVSYNRAFRSPSVINNYLVQEIFTPSTVDLTKLAPLAPLAPASIRPALLTPFNLRVRNVGNPNLKQEALTAYELSYTGTFRRTTIGLALYQNDQNDNINFTQLTPSAQNPAGLPGFDVYKTANAPDLIGLVPSASGPIPVPGPTLIGFLNQIAPLIGQQIVLPRTVTEYLNLGPTRQRGLEASIDRGLTSEVSVNANYSFQAHPTILKADSDQITYPNDELAFPAKHRFNVGVNYNGKRMLGTLGVNYSDKALWTDVLSKEYHGFTDAYTMVNATFGMKWMDGKLTTTLKAINLLDQEIQQHIYGDILRRQLYAEVRLLF
jgi:outer membrane receptor protein involved in Fe transport